MKSLFSDIIISYLSIGKIDGLYRYPLKGFSGENIESVNLGNSETFPDDRRFALLKHKEGVAFDPENPVWLHKENFLCAFTAPELMAKYRISFDDSEVLRLYDRSTDEILLPPMDFSSTTGRQVFADFFPRKRICPGLASRLGTINLGIRLAVGKRTLHHHYTMGQIRVPTTTNGLMQQSRHLPRKDE
jgi:hypothetical protein